MRLEQLCAACGIATHYTDIRGVRHEVDSATLLALLAEFDVDANSPLSAPLQVPPRITAPERCYLPPALVADGRIWGISAQLYALRSERNWGIGDFGDLARLIELAAQNGAGMVGISPLHALFPHDPARASPYSPSSRLRLNVLYLEIEAIEEFGEDEAAQDRVRDAAFQARLAQLRAAPLVDYAGVAAAKFEILELLYAGFRARHLAQASPRAREFRAFQARGGDVLRRHALYEALQAHFHGADASIQGWQAWPEPFRDPDSAMVTLFAEVQHERVEFYEYLQWQAELQLASARERCSALGLAVGLCLDLAVSPDRGGAEVWASQDSYARAASVGAPPDDFNPHGQNWGLPPPRPDRQRAQGYRAFTELLRASMRYAGALRIDHVMGLMRLFWIPHGRTAREGTYVHYALDELLAIVALESARNCCLVIGEDLGTVAEEVRTALARYGVLSYRLLYFERNADGAFRPPAEYPRDALVAVSTHDLPTLAGWWTGRDLELRHALGFFADEGSYRERQAERERARKQLLGALGCAGTPADLAQAVHAFLAATPARVMMVQLEDVLGMTEQANLPGTTDTHPNWQRKLPATLETVDLALGRFLLRRPQQGQTARAQ